MIFVLLAALAVPPTQGPVVLLIVSQSVSFVHESPNMLGSDVPIQVLVAGLPVEQSPGMPIVSQSESTVQEVVGAAKQYWLPPA